MRLVINNSATPRNAALLWQSMMILFCTVILLSGCKHYGPLGTQNFDPTYSRTLENNEQLLYSRSTEIVVGTYMEGEMESYPSYRGVLLMTDKRMMFAVWNVKEQRYDPTIWTDYSHVAKVKIHNNILMQYIAIVATDGNKFTYMLDSESVGQVNGILMEQIEKNHKVPMSTGPSI